LVRRRAREEILAERRMSGQLAGVRWLTLPCLLVAACGSNGRALHLDPNVPPYQGGEWYVPAAEATWQWQLTGVLDTGVDADIYDVDLFETSAESIAALQAAGRKVVCYFSAGSYEDWRPDVEGLDPEVIGTPLDGWPGERWLDVRADAVLFLALARLDDAVDKGCDAVEPDNVDGYAQDSGFKLTETDQLAFNRFLANNARSRGLGVALKNDAEQAGELVDYFDWSLNEECFDYDECDAYDDFAAAGLARWNAQYADDVGEAELVAEDVCPDAVALGLRTLILPLDLDGSFRVSCD
jgi:hypothetical protein